MDGVADYFSKVICRKWVVLKFAQFVSVLFFADYLHVIYVNRQNQDNLILFHESEHARNSRALLKLARVHAEQKQGGRSTGREAIILTRINNAAVLP